MGQLERDCEWCGRGDGRRWDNWRETVSGVDVETGGDGTTGERL